MQIAMVVPPYFGVPPASYGGVEAVVADLVDGLLERGHGVILVCAGETGTNGRTQQVWPHRIPELLGEPLAEVAYAAAAKAALRLLLDGERIDVVHDHTLAGTLLAASRPVPTVATWHGPMDERGRGLLADLAPDLRPVAISHRQRALAPEVDWHATIHHGLRVRDWPMRVLHPAAATFALFLGRMHPDKAPHLAVEAAHAAGLDIVLAGKCAEKVEVEYFESKVRPRLREGDVLFGMADAREKRGLLGRARALLMPIQWEEPFGMVMIEAMACGTPVVALRAGAVPEIVVDGVTGFVCDDLESFAAAIGEASRLDPGDCRSHVAARFGVDRMVREHEQAYARAIRPSASSASGAPRSVPVRRRSA